MRNKTYMELWNSTLRNAAKYNAAKSRIQKMEKSQSKIPRAITHGAWYVTNDDIRRAINIPSVEDEIIRLTNSHKTRIESHSNPLIINCYHNIVRKLKRRHLRIY